MIRIEPSETDDPRYLDLVTRILDGAIHCYKPVELYVIQIDTWFDHKWDGYSGRIGYCINAWLDPFRPPPFSPGRVKRQLVFRRSDAERFVFDRAKAPRLLHQRGPKDSHTRLKDLTSSGLYLWYSGNTDKVDRASLMVYSVQGQDNLGWYVSFLNRGEWKIGRTRGISPEELLLFARTNPEDATRTSGEG